MMLSSDYMYHSKGPVSQNNILNENIVNLFSNLKNDFSNAFKCHISLLKSFK